MNPIKLNIEGMTCGGCVSRVGKTIREIPGVTDARVTLEDHQAIIDTNAPVEASAIVAALDKKGYKATLVA